MWKRVFGGALLSAFLVFGIGACSDDATGPRGTGDLSVTLGQLDGSSSAAVGERSPRLSHVELSSVESIIVTVHRVQVHPVDPGEDGGSADAQGWIDLELTAPAQIDLRDLSSAPSLTVAEGEGLSAGQYDGVRFFFNGISVTFNAAQTVPGTQETITEGSLVVPSGNETGIKVSGASFTIETDGTTTFDAMWDASTSVANVTIASTNEVIMAPVLVADGDGGV